jgi:hypothetical protein
MRQLSWLALPLLLGTAAAAPALPLSQAVLTARVVGPPRQSLPRELTVRVRPSLGLKGQEALSWETTVTCPVRNGRWRCVVPAAERVDLRIEGAAVMPVYRWSETIGAGQATRLGTLRLRRGATISGWLRVDDLESRPRVPEHAVRVKLIPLGVPAPRIGLRPNPLPLVPREAGSQPWGFFRFDGLQPGLYTVEASEPGFAPARFGPLQIRGDRSIELREPLRLRHPAIVAGQIDPPLPRSRKGTWRVHLVPKPLPFPSLALAAAVGGDGQWSFRDLAPGDYTLSIKDPAGAAWMIRNIHLGPGLQTMNLNIPVRTLVGRVTQADRPLPSRLELRAEDETGPFKAEADEEGNFHTLVPEAPTGRTWNVQVQAPGILPVVLKDPVRQPFSGARLDILVPDTRLPVAVVDSRRRPVPFAKVVVPGEPENRFRTDATGFCEIRGLKPGLLEVLAEHPRIPCRSEAAKMVLREGVREPLLCLALPDPVEVYGRVEPTFGTAAGALVVARPSGTGPAISTRTDGDGEFRLVLPAGTRAVELAVLAPGAAFRKLRVEVDPKRLLRVPVDPAGGTLVLEIPEEILRRARESQTLESDLDLLCRWADLQGCKPEPGRLVVPNVEPGPYILSTGGLPKLEHGEPADPGDPRPHGVLEAEGELALRLPAS